MDFLQNSSTVQLHAAPQLPCTNKGAYHVDAVLSSFICLLIDAGHSWMQASGKVASKRPSFQGILLSLVMNRKQFQIMQKFGLDMLGDGS